MIALTNSSWAAIPNRVSTVKQAVTLLGISSVHALAIRLYQEKGILTRTNEEALDTARSQFPDQHAALVDLLDSGRDRDIELLRHEWFRSSRNLAEQVHAAVSRGGPGF